MARIFFIIIAGLFALAPVSPLSAQLSVGTFSTMTISIFPEHPGPNQSVTATFNGFSVDLDGARIQWFHNGRSAANGTGLKTYTFTTRGAGTEETLRAVATAPNGKQREASFSFRIGDVDLVWRADTSAPPWYSGKHLASPRSRVIVSAVPHLISGGREIPASQLIYQWSENGRFEQALSGAGKQTFAFRTGEANTIKHEITVEISNTSKSVVIEKSVTVPIQNPFVLFYEEHPLEGPRGRALSSVRPFAMARGDDKEFRAASFFFSGQAPLDYQWTINGAETEKAAPASVLRLKSGGFLGRAAIQTKITNLANIFQKAEALFYVDVQ
ncbi:MAG: hypothetical protein HYS44_02265 [Candidatus Niyogibacteria bacterium]|nr:hypothetical protein [Candidatus Niyogibacteria bacterium]